jgi:hypothetical protein
MNKCRVSRKGVGSRFRGKRVPCGWSLPENDSRPRSRCVPPNQIHVVKVPHHGSIKNHWPEICRQGEDGAFMKVAAFSAGSRQALPDRNVLKEYLESGWTAMTTTVRKAHPSAVRKSAEGGGVVGVTTGRTRQYDRPGDLHFRGAQGVTFLEYTIEIEWASSGKFSKRPVAAIVRERDLSAYGSAAD